MAVTDVIGALAVNVERTADEAARVAAADLSRYLRAAKRKKQPILLLASGGTALGIFGHVDKKVLGAYLTIGVLDERYDPTGRTSNSRALSLMRFARAAADKGVSFIEIKQGESRSPESIAKGFEKLLRAWRKKYPKGEMIATAGIGADGHTAGIMPYPEDQAFFQEQFCGKEWVSTYDAGGKNMFRVRITATMTFLKELKQVYVFATGDGKAGAIARMIEDGSLADTPARILREVPGTLYTDRALYNTLSRIKALV